MNYPMNHILHGNSLVEVTALKIYNRRQNTKTRKSYIHHRITRFVVYIFHILIPTNPLLFGKLPDPLPYTPETKSPKAWKTGKLKHKSKYF